jgi:hypothetical protein
VAGLTVDATVGTVRPTPHLRRAVAHGVLDLKSIDIQALQYKPHITSV